MIFFGKKSKAQIDGVYLSPGIGYSNHVFSYGAETGVYRDGIILAGVISTSKDAGSNHWSTFSGLKFYIRIVSFDEIGELYAFEGVYVSLFKPIVYEAEPGVAFIHKLSDNLSLQLSSSIPLYSQRPYIIYPAINFGVNFNFE